MLDPGRKVHVHRPDIDGLRALSVIAVIGFHAFPEHVRGGFVGVDVFFVISGFLIGTLLLDELDRGRIDLLGFYGRRVRRLFPALATVLAACLAAGWLLLLPDDFEALGSHVAGGAGFIANIQLAKEAGYFDAAAETKPLLHLWSLGIEEQFYAFWPLFLLLVSRVRRGAILGAVAIVSVSFVVCFAWVRDADPRGFYWPVARFWEIGAGYLLAYAQRGKGDPISAPRGRALSVIGFVMLGLAFLVIDRSKPFPGAWGLLPVVATCCIIAAGPRTFVNRILGMEPLTYLGRISYPLYLWHWPALVFLALFFGHTPSVAWRQAAIILTVGAAIATYEWVERPLRSPRRARRVTVGLGATMVVLAIAGLAAPRSQGFLEHFPLIVRELATYDHKSETIREWQGGRCLLFAQQRASELGECIDRAERADAPTIFLWGDSHAAALYPGLKERFKRSHTLVHVGASGCAPMLGVAPPGYPHCVETNELIAKRIAANKPDRVILAGAWYYCDWRRVTDTIAYLKRLGIARIDLVGPAPLWNGSLNRILMKEAFHLGYIPARLNAGSLTRAAELEHTMEALTQTQGVGFVSLMRILCTAEGCVTRTSDSSASITASDESHLTVSGSLYVGPRFPE